MFQISNILKGIWADIKEGVMHLAFLKSQWIDYIPQRVTNISGIIFVPILTNIKAGSVASFRSIQHSNVATSMEIVSIKDTANAKVPQSSKRKPKACPKLSL